MSKASATAALSILFVLSIPLSSNGQTRCPAGQSGCNLGNAGDRIRDRVDQGVRDVRNADTVKDRVDAVKETLKDCLDCGMDAVKGGLGGGDSGGSNDD